MIRERRSMAAIVIAVASMTHMSARGAGPSGERRPPQTVLTLDQAIRQALDGNLNLLAERFNVTVAETAVLTASLRPNPVVTVNLFRPDKVLVDAGISPNEQVFRTDYVFERGGKRRQDHQQDRQGPAGSRARSGQCCRATGSERKDRLRRDSCEASGWRSDGERAEGSGRDGFQVPGVDGELWRAEVRDHSVGFGPADEFHRARRQRGAGSTRD